MKKKLKLLAIILAVIVIIIGALFVWSGFLKRGDVGLNDFSVSEDGTKMTLNVGVSSSMGYTRGCSVKQEGDCQYVTFYSTFGALNSSLGAKNKVEIELDPSCKRIYFYHYDGSYREVLRKNESTNEWERVQLD